MSKRAQESKRGNKKVNTFQKWHGLDNWAHKNTRTNNWERLPLPGPQAPKKKGTKLLFIF